jgi:hypothetical protein
LSLPLNTPASALSAAHLLSIFKKGATLTRDKGEFVEFIKEAGIELSLNKLKIPSSKFKTNYNSRNFNFKLFVTNKNVKVLLFDF